MKQIFDWLREQLKDRSEVCYKSYLKLRSDEDYGCSFAYSHEVDLINEAEAKWESECCEWKRAEWNPKHVIESPHKGCIPLNIVDLQNHPHCGYCGKPIKISEVE